VGVRIKRLICAAEGFGLSPFLPAAAVVLITLFTVSLALAEPQRMLAARDDVSAAFETEDNAAILNDAVTGDETAILRAPVSPPHYHDRYRFYHRYDRYRARLHAGPSGAGP
jgi:hypothetical protein